MSNITRRSLLAGLATAPLLSRSAAKLMPKSSTRAADTSTRMLNVYLHGAYLLDLRTPCATVFFPEVTNHCYCAGYSPNSEGVDVKKSSWISLSGLNYTRPVPPLDNTAIPLYKTGTILTAGVYYTVQLPLPNAVVPLRQIPRNANCGDFFTQKPVGAPATPPSPPSYLANLTSLPLLIMLQYEIYPDDNPILIGGPNWIDDGRNPLILHFRGESKVQSAGDDGSIAQLFAMVGEANLQTSTNYFPSFACPRNPEEMSLMELKSGSTSCVSAVSQCPAPPKFDSPKRHIESKPANCVGIGNCPSCT